MSIYVADQLNGSVRQVVPATGSVTTLAGIGQQVNPILPAAPPDGGPQDGTGRAASFDEPAACVWDPVTGDVFVTDVAGDTIRRIH
jgi:DNA-binding beta-propeller fold protein YncE